MRCGSLLHSWLAADIAGGDDDKERFTRLVIRVGPVSAEVRAVGSQGGGHDGCWW